MTRLVLRVAVAMTLVLLLASGFVFWRVAYALDRQLDQDLDAWRTVVVHSVEDGTLPPTNTPGQTFQFYDVTGRLVGGNRDVPRLADATRVRRAGASGQVRYDLGGFLPAPSGPTYRVQLDRVRSPAGPVVVVTATRRNHHDEALRELLLQLGIADLLTLVAASVVGYRTARGALDPVEAYRRTAETADHQPGTRLPVARGRDDELSRLGETFNELLARIEEGAARERQFLADASHELRTPLALMSAELEWSRHRPRSPEEVARVLVSLQDQVGRLVGLSNALLEVEELRGTGPVSREPVDLVELVSDVVHRAVPSGTEVVLDVADVADVVVHVNGRWLEIALSNLLRNAVRHGAPPVHVRAGWEAPLLRIAVSDGGPGFPEDFVPVAFERFTRAERSRTTAGSGLGLHLVQAVAQAHGGSAAIRSHIDGVSGKGIRGAEVTLVIDGEAPAGG